MLVRTMDESQPFQIRRGDTADLDRLGDLWIGVHAQHQVSMPELAPYVTDAESWAARRTLYREVMVKPDSVLLLAHVEDELVGYGLAHVLETEAHLDRRHLAARRAGRRDRVPRRAAQPPRPGHRHGPARPLEGELATIGVTDLILGVLAGNVAAQRLYARLGYRPTWLYLSRGSADAPGSPGLGDL